MNYFDQDQAAERYAAGRPYFHSNTIEYVKRFLHLDGPLENALDVACGTGLSTKALLSVAENVYGTDMSTDMLRHVPNQEEITYSIAPADKQPFEDGTFDLLTVCSAVHWFDIDKFLKEANRVLKQRRWLVVYENLFIAEMDDDPNFQEWFRYEYMGRFPSPPRNNKYDWGAANIKRKGFTLLGEDTFRNPVEFTREKLILYFTTQTNIIKPLSTGMETLENTTAWLNEQLLPFFPEPTTVRRIHYWNWVKYLEKS
jgi:ubiquinone/menaquinone biosynthesis C-methylase UbiE